MISLTVADLIVLSFIGSIAVMGKMDVIHGTKEYFSSSVNIFRSDINK